MGYKEEIQKVIKKDELEFLWKIISDAYEIGGVEQIKSTLNERISSISKDYQEVLKKLEKML